MAQFQIVLAICLLCSIVSAQNMNMFLQKAALKGDAFMQNMPINQMVPQRNMMMQQQNRQNQGPFGLGNRFNNIPVPTQQQVVLPPPPPTMSTSVSNQQNPKTNPSQQILNQIEQIIKNQNKSKNSDIESSTKKPLPPIQIVNSKDNNFKPQPRPQVQPTPKHPPPTIQKPKFINESTHIQVGTTTPRLVSIQQTIKSESDLTKIRVGQNLPEVQKRQEIETSTMSEEQVLSPQQHLDSFHENSDVLKKQSLEIEKILQEERQRKLEEQLKQQEKMQEELKKKQESGLNQNLLNSESSDTETYLSYPQDYYKKYLNYEPCMSSPCPFGQKCVNKNDSRGFECVLSESQASATASARKLSGNSRKPDSRYQKFENSNEIHDVYEMIKGLFALNQLESKMNQARMLQVDPQSRSNLTKPLFTTRLQEVPFVSQDNQLTLNGQLDCPNCSKDLNELVSNSINQLSQIKEFRINLDVI